MDLGLMTASANPTGATMDDIIRDAAACANAGVVGVGNIAKAGLNMYNTVNNAFANPSAFFGQAGMNPYSANAGMVSPVPQAQYAYAEIGMNYGGMSYINPMTSQMPMGYPGFADPDYGVGSSMGFGGFGGNL
jgi:hypothetical protein